MDICNWSCLLNDFYKITAPNPHLHLHVRPRYKNPFLLNGTQYIDEDFGHHYNLCKGDQQWSNCWQKNIMALPVKKITMSC